MGKRFSSILLVRGLKVLDAKAVGVSEPYPSDHAGGSVARVPTLLLRLRRLQRLFQHRQPSF